mmetsp:Transcript_49610/g.97037  ORF Transcript_49610/g.97037 Transcript_49610/m.97037 type:complete len:240 (+) Transcript_49610:111-830(+)
MKTSTNMHENSCRKSVEIHYHDVIVSQGSNAIQRTQRGNILILLMIAWLRKREYSYKSPSDLAKSTLAIIHRIYNLTPAGRFISFDKVKRTWIEVETTLAFRFIAEEIFKSDQAKYRMNPSTVEKRSKSPRNKYTFSTPCITEKENTPSGTGLDTLVFVAEKLSSCTEDGMEHNLRKANKEKAGNVYDYKPFMNIGESKKTISSRSNSKHVKFNEVTSVIEVPCHDSSLFLFPSFILHK